eukprot:577114-Heterocapsa_arctica.AAC.1
MPKLPRNANGKVDRRALVDLQKVAPCVAPPSNGDVDDDVLSMTEQDIRAVWSEVLKVAPRSISSGESFFAGLGGNSLLAGR